MRLLIVVYSLTGNNRLLARHLGARLGAHVAEVRERRKRGSLGILLDLLLRRRPRIVPLGLDAAAYDHVLFLGPLWDRRIATPLLGAMDELAPALRGYSFASLCGYDRPGQHEHVLAELAARLGRLPAHAAELIVGKLVPPEQRGDVRKVSARRVTEAELAAFEPEIAAILGWFGTDGRGPAQAH